MTIKDIARLANVSVSTVSRCLNDSPLVADETKRRVRKIADETGFEFHAGARGLITQQAGTIGIILPDDFDRFYVQLYHSALHAYLRRALERADLDLLVGFSRNRYSGTDSIQRLVRRSKVDGLIIMTPEVEAETEAFLKSRGMPYVYSHYPPVGDRTDVDWVYVDHEKGGMLAGDLCARNGYHQVIALRSERPVLEFDLRVSGLKKALSFAGEDFCVTELEGIASYESGYELAQRHVEDFRRAEAVFALNDLMAIGVIQGLAAHGIRAGEQIAVIGYDDSPLAGVLHPLLTTIRQPAEEVAFLTCERLIEVIEDKQEGRPHRPRHIALQPQTVVRETTPSPLGKRAARRNSS